LCRERKCLAGVDHRWDGDTADRVGHCVQKRMRSDHPGARRYANLSSKLGIL
jgi:hypothetical protein